MKVNEFNLTYRIDGAGKKWICLLFVSLLFALVIWGGYLTRGESPFVSIMAGDYPSCSDAAIVQYTGLISGRNALSGFPGWDSFETCGRDKSGDVVSRPWNPFYIGCAFLVDKCGVDLFWFSGWIKGFLFLLFVFGSSLVLIECYSFSFRFACFSIPFFFFFPSLYYQFHFQNYCFVLVFVPILFLTLSWFKADSDCGFFSPKGLGLAFALGAPLILGMVNVAANLLLLAIGGMFYHCWQGTIFCWNRFWTFFRIILIALVIGIPGWIPMVVQMTESSGQHYVVGKDFSSINPVEFPVRVLSDMIQNSWVNRLKSVIAGVFPKTSQFTLTPFQRVPLVLFLIGIFLCVRKLSFEAFWFGFLLLFGSFYYFCECLNCFSLLRILDLFKVLKYQEILCASMSMTILLQGLSDGAQVFDSPFRKGCFILLCVLVCHSCYSGLKISGGSLSLVLADLGMVGEFLVLGPLGLGGSITREMIRYDYLGGLYRANLLINLMCGVILIPWLFYRKPILKALLGFLVLIGVLLGETGYRRCFFPARFGSDVSASEYFSIEPLERVVISMFTKGNHPYRCGYYDSGDSSTRKYPFRAAALKIPTVDGWSLFPSEGKRKFFEDKENGFIGDRSMQMNYWLLTDPLNPDLGKVFSVRYILSHIWIPSLPLLLRSPGSYWEFLYLVPGALPLLASREDLCDGRFPIILNYNESPDSFSARIETYNASEFVFSQMFHARWRLFVDGKEEPFREVWPFFIGFKIPSGVHQVELTFQSFSPFAWMGVSCIMVFLLIVFFQRGNIVQGLAILTSRGCDHA